MNANEVKDRLAMQAEDVCRRLLPSGKRRGKQWFAGSLRGDEGDSLVVEIDGTKTGVWSDFSTGEKGGGNLLELWRAVRGIEFKDAFRECCDYLGVSAEGFTKTFYPKPQKAKPVYKPAVAKFVPLRANGKVRQYLENERGLFPETIAQYRVAETEQGGGYVFPSYTSDGETLEMWKAVDLARTERGKKVTKTSSGTVKCLYGKFAVTGHSGRLVINEGEIDAISVAQVGGFAVSVPYGAKAETEDGKSPNDEWIDHEWDWLEQFTEIVLCFDADEEGEKATLAVLKRLGRERCRVVVMPKGCKDANDCVVQNRANELAAAIENARSLDPDELRNAKEYEDAVWERMHPPSGETPGVKFFLDIAFRIRPGELTVWTGFNGAGKSAFLTNMAVHLVSQRQRVCIGSFEMPPAHTLHIAARQTINDEEIEDRKHFESVMNWLSQGIWIFDRQVVKKWEDMLEVFTYARRRYGITQFIVDSLLKCGISSDDYNEQKRFVDTLQEWAKQEGVHVHLVAHQKKALNEKESGNKMGVKGAGEITDLAWNVASIWRNKDKEEALWAATNENNPAAHAEASKMIDGKLSFSKQRTTGDEPWVNLYFNRWSLRYYTDSKLPPQAYFDPKPAVGRPPQDSDFL